MWGHPGFSDGSPFFIRLSTPSNTMEPMDGDADITLTVMEEDTVEAMMTAMFLQLTLVSHRQVMLPRLLLTLRLIVAPVMGVASDEGPLTGTVLDSLGHW